MANRTKFASIKYGLQTDNTLPRTIRQVETFNEFKMKLKRHFKQ